MSQRFIVQHQFGSDYQIFDVKRGCSVASGLSNEEAEQTAQLWESERKDEIENAVSGLDCG